MTIIHVFSHFLPLLASSMSFSTNRITFRMNSRSCSYYIFQGSIYSTKRRLNLRLDATRSLPDVPQTCQPVQRVAIIGAGISGLALANALLASPGTTINDDSVQVDIFDSRPKLDESSGSGIQLTGGLVALKKFSSVLYKEVIEASLPLERVVSFCRPWWGKKNSTDNLENRWKLLDIDIQKAIKDFTEGSAHDGINYPLVTEEGEVMAFLILRGTLQKILYEGLIKDYGVHVQLMKKLCGISYTDVDGIVNPSNQGIMCVFDDGMITGPYDLVIGCDGVKSAVKQYVDTGEILSDEKSHGSQKTQSSALYSGIRITFAIQEGEQGETNILKEAAQVTQFFGNGAYALTSSYGAGKNKPPAKGAFIIYPDKNYFGPFKIKYDSTDSSATKASENADWTQDNRAPTDHISECLTILKMAQIPCSSIENIINNSDRFFDLGVYFHNPFSWNGWVREIPKDIFRKDTVTSKYAILVGDAAHAMPPFLGQGANQALQDAYVLASTIKKYNCEVKAYQNNMSPQNEETEIIEPNLKSLLKQYEHRRWLPTSSITAKAAFLGYLETGRDLFAQFRDIFFFVMGKLGVAKKVYLDSANPKL